MKIVQSLCGVGLAPLMSGVRQAPGFDTAAADTQSVAKAVSRHLRDIGQPLADALQRSLERAWLALELVLDGPAWQMRLPGLPDRALAAQFKAYLDAMSMPELEGKSRFRQQCLGELQTLRRGGKLFPVPVSVDVVTSLSGTLVRFLAPTNVPEGERLLTKVLADELKALGQSNLAWLVSQRPATGDGLLPAAVKSFFRREVEDNDALFRAFRPQGRQGLDEAREAGFTALSEAFQQQGDRMAALIDQPPADAPAAAAPPAAPFMMTLPARSAAPAQAPPRQEEPVPVDVVPVVPLSSPRRPAREDPDDLPVLDVIPVGPAEPLATYKFADEDEEGGGGRYDHTGSKRPDRRRRERPDYTPFLPVDFRATVEEDPKDALHGQLPARVRPGTLVLWMDGDRVEVPVGSKATAPGGNRLEVEVAGRTVTLAVKAPRASAKLAEDVADYLNEKTDSLDGKNYQLPGFLVPVAVTVAVSLVFILMIVLRVAYTVRRDREDRRTAEAQAQAGAGSVTVPPPKDDTKVNKQGEGAGGPQARRVMTVPVSPHAVALDSQNGRLWAVDGESAVEPHLRQYTFPAGNLVGAYRLGFVCPYQVVLDESTGRLYAAVASRDRLGSAFGKAGRIRGQGDIHVYEVKRLPAVAPGQPPVSVLPIDRLNVNVRVGGMVLSPDRRWLYYLDTTSQNNVRLVRVNTATFRQDGELRLIDGAELLRASPDGRKLVVATLPTGREDPGPAGFFSPRLQVIDADRFVQERTWFVRPDFYDMDVGPNQRAYLSGRGPNASVHVIDLTNGNQMATWAGANDSCHLRVSRNGRRLYLVKATWPGRVSCWALPDRPGDAPQQGLAGDNSDAGEPTLSSDGRYLALRGGAVYELLNAN